MKSKIGEKIISVLNREYTVRQQFIFGVIAVLAVSIIETLKHRALNYYIYEFATNEFWSNIFSPYVDFTSRNGCDVFIYLPPFFTIFSLFTLLPQWLGPIVWNVLNFSLLFLAIRTLPSLNGKQKQLIFLYPFLITLQTLFSFQYNVVVAYLFLFAFVLLENKKYWWGLLLISISMLTKVYGGVEFLLLLFYPQFWKNVGRTLIVSILVFISPMINWSCNLMPLYSDWYASITTHQMRQVYETVTRLLLVDFGIDVYNYASIMLALVLAIVVILTFIRKNQMGTLANRYMLLGLLMSTVIVWGVNSEIHTYCIYMLGFTLWYIHLPKRNRFVKILFWLNFVILSIIPVDVFCPRFIYNFVIKEYVLNMILVLVTWGTMLYYTFFSKKIE